MSHCEKSNKSHSARWNVQVSKNVSLRLKIYILLAQDLENITDYKHWSLRCLRACLHCRMFIHICLHGSSYRKLFLREHRTRAIILKKALLWNLETQFSSYKQRLKLTPVKWKYLNKCQFNPFTDSPLRCIHWDESMLSHYSEPTFVRMIMVYILWSGVVPFSADLEESTFERSNDLCNRYFSSPDIVRCHIFILGVSLAFRHNNIIKLIEQL